MHGRSGQRHKLDIRQEGIVLIQVREDSSFEQGSNCREKDFSLGQR